MTVIYTENQIRAIQHRTGNLQIIACAGSGKTEVISRRIAELVNEGINREAIVAFAFNDRAAAELKARIRKHLEEMIPSDPALGGMYVGTVHSFCLQLLRELKPEYRNYEVIDEEQQAAYVASNFYDLRLNVLRQRDGLGWFQTVGIFRNTLSTIYLEGIAQDEIEDEDLQTSVGLYHEGLRSWPMYFLDFNSIIAELIEVLNTDADLRGRVQTQFQYIVVDEYQDIDPRQEELIGLLVGGGAHLCVVGDDDQAIYGWRGAEIRNILTFSERYNDVTEIELVENFRSTHVITEVGNRAARSLTSRLDKDMRAVHWEERNGDNVLVETMAERGDVQRVTFNDANEEARYIADRIEYLRGVQVDEGEEMRALDWADMAVLFRSVRRYAAPLVDELQRRGIPFVVRGARGLFEHDEIRLIQGVWHLLVGEDLWEQTDDGLTIVDEQQLRERVRTLITGLGDEAMPGIDEHRVFEWIAERKRQLDLASLPRDQRPAGISRRVYPQEIFHEMMETMGASENRWNEGTMYNLGRFSNLLTKYEAVHQWLQPRDLVNLLRYLNNWSLEEGGPSEMVTLNAVQLVTIHSSKGLEWPVVFVPGIHSYHFPSSRRNQGMTTFLGNRYATGDDGERRLWYVAITRCKKFLHLSAISRTRRKPSVFFREICHSYVLDSNTDPTRRRRGTPAPPISAELLPTTYSDLNYYWHCPYDYKLRRLMGFGPSIGQEFGYGQQIHNLLAQIHEIAREGDVLDEGQLRDLVEQHFTLRYTTGEPFETMRVAAGRTLGNYLSEIGSELPQLVLDTEKPFEFVMEGALISGTIDLLERVDEASGERIPVGVVDFKTGIDEDEEQFGERLSDARRQVVLYAIAAREALRLDPRRAAVHFLDTKRQVRENVKIDDTSRRELESTVGETVGQIKGGVFPREPIGGCRRCERCDLRRICPGPADG